MPINKLNCYCVSPIMEINHSKEIVRDSKPRQIVKNLKPDVNGSKEKSFSEYLYENWAKKK